jgi:hypothetical protein
MERRSYQFPEGRLREALLKITVEKYSAPPNPNAPKARRRIPKFLRLKYPAIGFKFDSRHSQISGAAVRYFSGQDRPIGTEPRECQLLTIFVGKAEKKKLAVFRNRSY